MIWSIFVFHKLLFGSSHELLFEETFDLQPTTIIYSQNASYVSLWRGWLLWGFLNISLQCMMLCGTYAVPPSLQLRQYKWRIRRCMYKTEWQQWEKKRVFSVHTDLCDEIRFLFMITAAKPWRVRDKGYPRLCLHKTLHSTLLTVAVYWNRCISVTVLIWTVWYPGFKAHIDKTWTVVQKKLLLGMWIERRDASSI